MSLQNLHILVTRPAQPGRGLCALIEAAGGHAIHIPAMEIEDPAHPETAQAALSRLHEFDIAIFVSVNAVDKTMALMGRRTLPQSLAVAAVGQKTADRLFHHGISVNIKPQPPYNSESLLAAESLQHARGKRILIIRGEGGRELLAETLRQRGAQVEYAEVYRRRAASVPLDEILNPAQRDAIDIVVVTSNEILSALADMTQGDYRAWLLRTPLAVIGERTAALARELGFTHPPIVAKTASDEALVEAIEQWRGQG